MNLTPPRSGPRRLSTVLLSVGLLATGLVAALPGTAGADVGCSVSYSVVGFWGTGFQAGLTITPGAAVTSWTVDFELADQQVMTNTHNALFAQTGSHVRLTNASFNGTVGPGASALVGLSVYTNPTLSNVPPAAFSVNGRVCSYIPPPYLVAGAYRVVVPEGGSVGIPIQLSQAPPADTVFTVYSPGGSFSTTPASLTFTPTNWNVPQIVTVTSPEDADTTNQGGVLPINQQSWVQPVYTSVYLGLTQQDNDA
jgi:hypothetical protein